VNVISNTIRKASRQWSCGLCLCDIAKGEEYNDQVNDNDGNSDGLIHFRSHIECQPMATYWDLGDDDRYDEECLRAFVLEAVGHIGAEAFAVGLQVAWADRVMAIANRDEATP